MANANFVYGTGFMRPTSGGKLLVDSATLISLAKADRLDLLLRTGRAVVITSTVEAETTGDLGFPTSRKINDWIDAHEGQGVIVDSNPAYPGPGPDNGERSIEMYVSSHAGEDMRVVSGDVDWIDNGLSTPTLAPPGS